MRPQAGLYVTHGDLQVEARQCRCEAGRGVAVDQDDVGPLVLEDGLELEQHVARHVEHILIASGRVPKTSMIFFIIGPFSCAEPYGHESYKKQRTIASLQKEEPKTKLP